MEQQELTKENFNSIIDRVVLLEKKVFQCEDCEGKGLKWDNEIHKEIKCDKCNCVKG